ncbi:MAG: KUP/HAK/KT family potassium transporter [Acidimicrobiia bacterium]|nr:KUP/HAK/KT family potassium transporter [Acidimicrobiia bacterium]
MGEISSEGNRRSRRRLGLLTVGAIGVVFGDIGTSPLYAFTQIFSGAHTIPVVEARVLGALSMVFWTLTLVVSVKYVVIVMRADNQGEGGIMVLASLASNAVKRHRASAGLMLLGLIGAALFYGDGLITPAVSVLSAVEGIGVAAPSLDRLVIPIALAILFLFFAVQRFGTGRVGRVFGPIMIVWFLSIAILGLASVIKTPGVLRSINPYYAFTFFSGEPGLAFLALGAIVLCVTGAEALYADMGQFGRSPIRLSWFAIVAPALYLNYLGQRRRTGLRARRELDADGRRPWSHHWIPRFVAPRIRIRHCCDRNLRHYRCARCDPRPQQVGRFALDSDSGRSNFSCY